MKKREVTIQVSLDGDFVLNLLEQLNTKLENKKSNEELLKKIDTLREEREFLIEVKKRLAFYERNPLDTRENNQEIQFTGKNGYLIRLAFNRYLDTKRRVVTEKNRLSLLLFGEEDYLSANVGDWVCFRNGELFLFSNKEYRALKYLQVTGESV